MAENPTHITQELLARMGEGDEDAFTVIFHKYNASVFTTVNKLVKSPETAREIIQDTFLKLWLNRRTVAEMQNPQGWLHTAAANLCLDALRKQARQPVITDAANEELVQQDPTPSLLLEGKEIGQLVEEAVSKLPGARKQIFDLSRKSGLNRRQIAEQLNISESTVKNQLTSSLKFIQDYLRERGADIPLPVMTIIFFLSQ